MLPPSYESFFWIYLESVPSFRVGIYYKSTATVRDSPRCKRVLDRAGLAHGQFTANFLKSKALERPRRRASERFNKLFVVGAVRPDLRDTVELRGDLIRDQIEIGERHATSPRCG